MRWRWRSKTMICSSRTTRLRNFSKLSKKWRQNWQNRWKLLRIWKQTWNNSPQNIKEWFLKWKQCSKNKYKTFSSNTTMKNKKAKKILKKNFQSKWAKKFKKNKILLKKTCKWLNNSRRRTKNGKLSTRRLWSQGIN